MTTNLPLAGCHLLLVEDEFLVAVTMAECLAQYGAHILGPASNVSDALHLAHSSEPLNAALLDVNLQGEPSYEVLDWLQKRGVPCVLMTGYDHEVIPRPYASVPWLHKPTSVRDLLHAIQSVVN